MTWNRLYSTRATIIADARHSANVSDGPSTRSDTITGGCYFDFSCRGKSTSLDQADAQQATDWGIFSVDHTENAEFRDFNKLYFADACVPDNYLGASGTRSGTSPNGFTFPYAYQGGQLIEGFLSYLREGPIEGVGAAGDASHIVLYGWSGGGRAIINLIDRLADGEDGGWIAENIAAFLEESDCRLRRGYAEKGRDAVFLRWKQL